MIEFKAEIDAGPFYFEIVADIYTDGDVIIRKVYFDGCDEPLTDHQVEHFIKSYGEDDLTEEVRSQYRIERDAYMTDQAGLEWETVQFKRRSV